MYLDEGDCAQTLSNLTLIPLAAGRATFTADDVQSVIDQARTGRVASRVSAISIETPVRRQQGERFDPAELQKIVAIAQRDGIRLHLDGARLFLQTAFTGENIAETVRPFDTVYISLYKYFNAASGAILAGPRAMLDDMYHVRRMFGGGLNARVAVRCRRASLSHRVRRALRPCGADVAGSDGRPAPSRRLHDRAVPDGHEPVPAESADEATPPRSANALPRSGVMLSAPQGDTFLVGVNETLNRMTAADLTEAFTRALAG